MSCNGMKSRRRACGVHRRTAERGQCKAVGCARSHVSIGFDDSYDLYVILIIYRDPMLHSDFHLM
ncbi:hypothetical protein ETAE_0485 [Edwardsiella piscicida]|uniref:Uncharacterized protein n=1 Tax=Edwardsiella piscicida TaxID=1263550 RepID=A0AAU8P822_EDWPI|nr:hypothetical protein ETAE_0485 [Edwardsiella tarda EIB202]